MKEISLTQGKVAIVDDCDYDALNEYKWHVLKKKTTCYAVASDKHRKIYMHRLIMGITDSKQDIDHINSNGLDNQRNNLRVCNRRQNIYNMRKRAGTSSRYKGVSFFRPTNKWQAKIRANNKTISLGLFNTEEEAALAYNTKAKQVSNYIRLNELTTL